MLQAKHLRDALQESKVSAASFSIQVVMQRSEIGPWTRKC